MKTALTLFATLLLSMTTAHAAQYNKISNMTGQLKLLHEFLDDISLRNGSDLDMSTSSFQVTQKTKAEKWENTIQQIFHAESAPFEIEVDISKVRRTSAAINKAFSEVLLAGGIDEADLDGEGDSYEILQIIDKIQERLENDFNNSTVLAFKGGIGSGSDLSHQFLALVDLETNQILVFRAGSSE